MHVVAPCTGLDYDTNIFSWYVASELSELSQFSFWLLTACKIQSLLAKLLARLARLAGCHDRSMHTVGMYLLILSITRTMERNNKMIYSCKLNGNEWMRERNERHNTKKKYKKNETISIELFVDFPLRNIIAQCTYYVLLLRIGRLCRTAEIERQTRTCI